MQTTNDAFMRVVRRFGNVVASYDLRAVALPPLRPAAFFCAVVPPCDELLRELDDEPDFFPPRLDAPGEFAIFAARSFDMPLSFSASYCFSFLTFARLLGMVEPPFTSTITLVCKKESAAI
jgi:hypothetical protein